MNINYQSDFKIIERLMPDAPFRFTYYVAKDKGSVTAEYDGQSYSGCFVDGERLIVPVDGGTLGIGSVRVKREYFLDDKAFADGVCNLVSVEGADIELGRGRTDSDIEADVEVGVYYKTFTFDDMTEEQKQEIADRVPTKEAEREKAEAQRVEAENVRVEAEKGREAAEAARQATFTANEESRQSTFDTNEAEREAEFNAAIQSAKDNLIVVNDLTTGGADKALSAEMGKELKEELNAVNELLIGGFSEVETVGYLSPILSDYKVDADGNIVSATGYYIKIVPVTQGEYVRLKSTGGGIYAFSETVPDVQSEGMQVLMDATGTTDASIDVQIEATGYIVISYFSGRNEKLVLIRLQKNGGLKSDVEEAIEQNKADIEQNKADIEQIQSEIVTYPEISYTFSDFVDGYYIVSNTVGSSPGNPVAIAGYAYKYIDVQEGEQWDMHLNGGINGRAWALLDINGKIVEFSQDTGKKDYSVVIPEGVVSMLVQTSYYSDSDKDSTFVIREAVLSELDKKIQELKADIEQNQTLKILCFGNSFTQDSMSYVPAIMKNVAPHVNLTIGMAVIGGCPLIQHLVNFTGTSLTLDAVTYSVQNYSYQKSVNGGAWKAVSANVDTMLADEEWDIITFQQNGGTAHKDYDTYYAPYIYPLLKALFNKVSRAIKVGWLSIHGTYASTDQALLSNWEGVVANTQRVLDTSVVSVVFPFGTAVQNLRTVDEVNALGDTGHLLADGGHLQDGIGCLCAAYCNTLKILEMLGIGKVGVIGEPTRITSQFISDNNIQGTNLGTSGSIIGMEEDYVYLAQVAATKAALKPYEVTDINANAV